MTDYILCIHCNKVTFEETISAFCLVWAMQIAEARYGKDCVLGCLGGNRFNDSAEQVQSRQKPGCFFTPAKR